MTALRNGAKGGILKFFLMGLLCLAAGGLVFTDVGGFFRGGGVGGNNIAKIGKDKISLPEFENIVRRTLAPLGITPAQAHQFGYLGEVLNSEIRRRMLIRAASEYGITVSQDHVIEQIQTILSPAIQSGANPQDALANLLRQQGMSEAGLMSTIASEKTLSLLNTALQSGALSNSHYLEQDLHDFQNETRSIRYIPFPHKSFKEVVPADDAQLTQIYESTKNAYAIAETRDIQLLHIKTDAVKKAISISDDTLKAAYEENIEDYTQEPSRKIAQAIAKNEEEANNIIKSAKTGKSLKSLVKAGNYLPPKSFTEDKILDELAEAVFAAEATGIIGPIETPLGWSIVDLQKIEDERVESFAKVKDELKNDLLADQLIDEIYALLDEVDDAFAAGGTIDDVAAQFNLNIETVPGINAAGLNKDNKNPLANPLGKNETNAIQIAFDLEQGETSSAIELENGNFVVISVKSITLKSYQDFESVKDILQTNWMNDQRAFSNRNAVRNTLEQNSGESLTDIAKTMSKKIKKTSGLKRDAAPKAPFNKRSITTAFEAAPGALFLMDIDDGIAIAEIQSAKLPENSKDEDINALRESILKDQQNELFLTYLGKQSEKYGVSVNQGLIDQYYNQQSEN